MPSKADAGKVAGKIMAKGSHFPGAVSDLDEIWIADPAQAAVFKGLGPIAQRLVNACADSVLFLEQGLISAAQGEEIACIERFAAIDDPSRSVESRGRRGRLGLRLLSRLRRVDICK